MHGLLHVSLPPDPVLLLDLAVAIQYERWWQ